MKIAVISPHPDDESLGAGGLIIKHKKKGNQVYWINVTDVEENQGWDSEFVQKRKKQIQEVLDFYKFDGFYNLKFKPSSLESIEKGDIISALGKCVQEIQPDWIVLPNPTDAHSDHLITYEAGMSCTKTFRYPYIKKVMTMEILSETDFSKDGNAFSPNYYVDITEEIDGKIEALELYDTEFGQAPFPRNYEAVRALALLRGGASGCRYAEAFRIVKEVER